MWGWGVVFDIVKREKKYGADKRRKLGAFYFHISEFVGYRVMIRITTGRPCLFHFFRTRFRELAGQLFGESLGNNPQAAPLSSCENNDTCMDVWSKFFKHRVNCI